MRKYEKLEELLRKLLTVSSFETPFITADIGLM